MKVGCWCLGAPSVAQRAAPEPVFLLGEHHDAAPFGGLVGKGGQLGPVGELLDVTPGSGTNSTAWRLPA